MPVISAIAQSRLVLGTSHNASAASNHLPHVLIVLASSWASQRKKLKVTEYNRASGEMTVKLQLYKTKVLTKPPKVRQNLPHHGLILTCLAGRGCSSTNGQHRTSPDILPESGSEYGHAAENTVLVNKSSSSAVQNGDRGAKRSSKLSACDQCYRFKVKCVRNGDSCQRCTGNSSICTYSFSSTLEEDNDVNPLTSGYTAKRRRFANFEQQPSVQTRTEDQPSNDRLHENEWAGTNGELPRIHVDEEIILEPNPGILERSSYDNTRASLSNKDQAPSTSVDMSDQMYHFSSQTVNLDPVIPACSPPTNDTSGISLPYTNNQVLDLQEIFTNADHQTNDSCESYQTPNQEIGRHSECSCLVSALSTLSKLHDLGQPMTCTETNLDLNRILSTTHDSLLICGKISDCRLCSRYTMLMLCITILQKIITCYEILPSSINDNHVSLPLSIKIGDMEFSEVSYAPVIMQAVLSGERKKASGVCESLLNVYGRDSDMRGNAYKGGTGMRELLDLLKRSFTR